MNKQVFSLLFLMLALSLYASAQVVGDYRSNANNFNWNGVANWQRWDGAAWVAPTAGQGYPGETASSIAGTVTIRAGHTVTLNVDVTTNDIGNLVVTGTLVVNANNMDLDMTGNLTITGTFDVNGNNCTFDVGGSLTMSGNSILNLDNTDSRIGIVGAATLSNNAVFTLNADDLVVNIGGNLSLQNAAILNLSANNNRDQDITVTGNLTMDATSQIQGNHSEGRMQVNGTFTVPVTATNARIGGCTFTVNGATTVPGTITFNSNTGVKTFKGRVIVDGSWTSTSITSNDRLVFGGEVITSGTFACGCN